MPISEKDTAKAIKLLQQLRDELEQAADQYGAGKINIAIASIIEASTEAERKARLDMFGSRRIARPAQRRGK